MKKLINGQSAIVSKSRLVDLVKERKMKKVESDFAVYASLKPTKPSKPGSENPQPSGQTVPWNMERINAYGGEPLERVSGLPPGKGVGITVTVAAIIIKNMPDKKRSQDDGKSEKTNRDTRQSME